LRRPNYNAAKRTRELKQKAKRDAKLARKQSRTAQPGSPTTDAPDSISAPAPGVPEPERDPLTPEDM
jgi:hypothetical protein